MGFMGVWGVLVVSYEHHAEESRIVLRMGVKTTPRTPQTPKSAGASHQDGRISGYQPSPSARVPSLGWDCLSSSVRTAKAARAIRRSLVAGLCLSSLWAKASDALRAFASAPEMIAVTMTRRSRLRDVLTAALAMTDPMPRPVLSIALTQGCSSASSTVGSPLRSGIWRMSVGSFLAVAAFRIQTRGVAPEVRQRTGNLAEIMPE